MYQPVHTRTVKQETSVLAKTQLEPILRPEDMGLYYFILKNATQGPWSIPEGLLV